MSTKFYISLIAMAGLIFVGLYQQLLLSDFDSLAFLFLYSIPSNLAISIFPHEPFVVYFGTLYAPYLIAAIAMAGTLIAGILDYYVFAPIMEHRVTEFIRNTKDYKRASKLFNYQPFIAIVIGGFTPVPFFIFKLLAFANKYSVSKYLIALTVGRYPRYYLLAYMGSLFEIPPLIIFIIFVLMVLFYVINTWLKYRKMKSQKDNDFDSLNEEVLG